MVACAAPEEEMSRAQFEQIEIGMLPHEVRAVAGWPARETESEEMTGFTGAYARLTEKKVWPAEDGGEVTVVFVDKAVVAKEYAEE
jgi:hypothetical protein